MKIRYETLDSFVTIYLNSKFGLKNIVEDWRLGFKQGVNKFHKEEIDILLFKTVLENEVDEDYVIIHNELKKTIGDSLKVILKVFYKEKNEFEAPEHD